MSVCVRLISACNTRMNGYPITMRDDIVRWNKKYRDGNPNPDLEPDSILTSHSDLLDGKGTALDLACGVGHNAIYLAARGYHVIAVDGSITGLRYGRAAIRKQKLPISLIAADLEHFTLPTAYFDLVLIVRFLYRPLFTQIKRSLKPNGLLIYKTFNINHHRKNPGFNEEYLVKHGELKKVFSDFHLIATNDSEGLEDNLTHLIARKPS